MKYSQIYKMYYGKNLDFEKFSRLYALPRVEKETRISCWQGFREWIELKKPNDKQLADCIEKFMVSKSENWFNEQLNQSRKKQEHLMVLLFKSTHTMVWEKAKKVVQKTINDLQDAKTTNVKQIQYILGKSAFLSIYGGLADICIAADEKLFHRDNFTLLSMVSEGQFLGFCLVHVINENNQVIFALAGVEPCLEYMSNNDAATIYQEVITVLIKFAIKANVSKIVQVNHYAAYSNRTALSRYIESEIIPNSKKGTLTQTLKLSTKNYWCSHYTELWQG